MNNFNHENIQYETDSGMKFSISESTGRFVASHWHNSLEIIYVISGSMELTEANREFKLNSGGFIIINSKSIHSTCCSVGSKTMLLQIPYDILKKSIPDIDIITIRCTCNGTESLSGDMLEIKDILLSLTEMYDQERDSAYLLLFNSTVYNLLYKLIKNFKIGTDPVLKRKTDRNIQRLGLVLQYARQHYSENISLQNAADSVALNKEYFSRFFKKYMGMTYMEYVFSIRLEYAYNDLINTDYPITEIIEHNGFQKNYRLFMEKFKKQYGCTPGERRKQLKAER